jgi:hypothetical protein
MNVPQQPTNAPSGESATVRPSLRGERQTTERVATRSDRDQETPPDESNRNQAPDRGDAENSDRSQQDANRTVDDTADNNQSRDKQE